MSVPLAPKKSCYTQLQDNRKGAKTNSDSLLSLGDTNANQIVVEVSPSYDESEPCDLTDEIGNANSHEPGNSTHFHKELHQLQSFEKGSKAAPTSLKDFKFSLTARGELTEEHTTQRGTALLQTPQTVQGPGLAGWRNVMGEASPDILAKRGAEIPRHAPKDKLAKTLDNEELRRHALERASGPPAGMDTFAKEHSGGLSRQLLPPAPLDSTGVPGHGDWVGVWPQKAVTAHTPGTAFPPADSTSEGKSVRHPKPSTSETQEHSCLETQMEGGHVREVSKESTPRSAHAPSASQEVLRKPEAQLSQGKGEQKPELTLVQPRTVQELVSAQAECLWCPKEVPSGEAQQEATTQALSSPPAPGSPHPLGLGRSGNEQNKGAMLPEEQGPLQTPPRQGPASVGAVDNQAPGKISPSAARRLGDSASSSASPGDGHVAFIPDDPTDSRPSGVAQEKGNRDSAMVFPSDASVGESKTGIPEPLDPQSSSSEPRESKEVPMSVAENRNLLENAVKTESTPARTDSLLGIPAPLHPETTVNVSHQPAPPSTRFQDVSMLSVDAGSPSDVSMLSVDAGSPLAAPPPTDSVWLWNTSPKVPDKNTCPSGIPKPVSTHPEATPSPQGGLENPQVDKTEERTEPKPVILPKPKHVRPKIITYIRRSPQTLGQVDTSLVPMGLPYAPPTCDTPLPKEEKVAGGDLKPAVSLYEKFKPDLQKPRVFTPGLMVSGIRPPGHHFTQMSEKFLQEVRECHRDMV